MKFIKAVLSSLPFPFEIINQLVPNGYTNRKNTDKKQPDFLPKNYELKIYCILIEIKLPITHASTSI